PLVALSHSTYPTLDLLSSVLIVQRPPISTLFPYTTLFRSRDESSGEMTRLRQTERSGRNRSARPLTTLPLAPRRLAVTDFRSWEDRKSTRLNSSHRTISYAVFCLKKKNMYELKR